MLSNGSVRYAKRAWVVTRTRCAEILAVLIIRNSQRGKHRKILSPDTRLPAHESAHDSVAKLRTYPLSYSALVIIAVTCTVDHDQLNAFGGIETVNFSVIQVAFVERKLLTERIK